MCSECAGAKYKLRGKEIDGTIVKERIRGAMDALRDCFRYRCRERALCANRSPG